MGALNLNSLPVCATRHMGTRSSNSFSVRDLPSVSEQILTSLLPIRPRVDKLHSSCGTFKSPSQPKSPNQLYLSSRFGSPPLSNPYWPSHASYPLVGCFVSATRRASTSSACGAASEASYFASASESSGGFCELQRARCRRPLSRSACHARNGRSARVLCERSDLAINGAGR